MVFRLDPKKFSELEPEPTVSGSEIVPIVVDGENRSVLVQTIWDDGLNGDKYFTQEFVNLDEVHVQHNLGKKPAVTIMNSAGDEVIGDINYINDNELTILFSGSFSGTLTCN